MSETCAMKMHSGDVVFFLANFAVQALLGARTKSLDRKGRKENPQSSLSESVLRFQFFQDRAAALTYGRIRFIFADVSRIIPAALTFCSIRFLHFHVNSTSPVA